MDLRWRKNGQKMAVKMAEKWLAISKNGCCHSISEILKLAIFFAIPFLDLRWISNSGGDTWWHLSKLSSKVSNTQKFHKKWKFCKCFYGWFLSAQMCSGSACRTKIIAIHQGFSFYSMHTPINSRCVKLVEGEIIYL